LRTTLAVIALYLAGGTATAQESPGECVVMGALAFDDWTKTAAGGSGPPSGVQNLDYVRCAACHGWDRRGTEGGSARRERTRTSPNAGAGDGDSRSRAIETGSATAAQVRHAGSGRTFAQGQGSWVPLSANRTASNTAAHAQGYTLGNQHPDFSNSLTQEQVDCLVEFLNYADGDPGRYFADIDPGQNPVLYTPVALASTEIGEAFFENRCEDCHTLTSVVAFFENDGAPSELSHIARWGIPDTDMTRDAIGNPAAVDIADLMAFLQRASNTGFRMNPGLTGTWWNGPDRNGEGLLFEVAWSNGQLYMFATLYTYDAAGNQTWLIAQGLVDGDMVDVDVFITDGPAWGEDYDPADFTATPWGTGSFLFSSCTAGAMSLLPNSAMQALGFTPLAYDLRRDLLTSGIACPTPTAD
jgi:hypothetical protein